VPNFKGSLSDEHFTTSVDLILHFLPNFAFFCLGPIVANLHAKVEVFIYNRCRDREGVPNFKSRSRDHFATSFDLILHFA